MAAESSSWDRYCLIPLLGKEGKSLSGKVNIKCLDRKAYSQAVLLLLGRASCLERLWVRLFKGTIDPQPAPCSHESEPGEEGELRPAEGARRKGAQNSPAAGKPAGEDEDGRCVGWRIVGISRWSEEP